MIFIAHRGNVNGIIKNKENRPEYLEQALSLGFNVEADIWHTGRGWFLGHEAPLYKITARLFSKMNPKRVWYHAKNYEALYHLLQDSRLHCFWHENDSYTLTSQGFMWVHSSAKILPKGSICVLPEIRKTVKGLERCGGICSDVIGNYKNNKSGILR